MQKFITLVGASAAALAIGGGAGGDDDGATRRDCSLAPECQFANVDAREASLASGIAVLCDDTSELRRVGLSSQSSSASLAIFGDADNLIRQQIIIITIFTILFKLR